MGRRNGRGLGINNLFTVAWLGDSSGRRYLTGGGSSGGNLLSSRSSRRSRLVASRHGGDIRLVVRDQTQPVPSSGHDTLLFHDSIVESGRAFDPSLFVNHSVILVGHTSEYTGGSFVSNDFTPFAITVFEQVAGREDGRVGVVDGLDVGAV